MAEVEYRILGPVEVLRGGQSVPTGGSTASVLLTGLLLSANQIVSGERLAEIVWGESPPKRPRSALHSAVSRLRRTVVGDALEGLAAGYRLNVGDQQLDLLRSDRLVAAAKAAERRGALDEAAFAAREALGLWRGCPFGNIDSPALHADAARLAEKHLALHELHADLCLRVSQHTVVAQLLAPLVRTQPFRERLVGQLMLALFRGGRQAEALAAYESLSTGLRHELGIGPSQWLRDLHVRILRADSGLEADQPRMSQAEPEGRLPLPQDEIRAQTQTQAQMQTRTRTQTQPQPQMQERAQLQPSAAAIVSPLLGESRAASPWRGLRPASQRLVGRDQEIEELSRTLRAAPVVTFVGPAGVGKTSVALKAAERLAADFADGVAVVELGLIAATAESRQPTDIGGSGGSGGSSGDDGATRIAATVWRSLHAQAVPGPDALEALTAELRPVNLLLVLDNAEHVAAECGRLVDHLARTCPGVTVLTTSRRPLGIGAETVAELAPLEPGLTARLLRLRTFGHSPCLDLGADPDGVAELCRQLDGLPLAVELSALRLRTMSLRALLWRLGRQRGLLSGGDGARLPHQRALDSTLEWSYRLLTPCHRLLLRRLALFEGAFTLEDAERPAGHAAGPREEVAGLLGGLVEQSMVQPLRGGDYSYRLLLPVRRFVLARAASQDAHELPVARHSHRLRGPGGPGHRLHPALACVRGGAL